MVIDRTEWLSGNFYKIFCNFCWIMVDHERSFANLFSDEYVHEVLILTSA